MNNNAIRLEVIPEPLRTTKKVLIINPPETVFFLDDGNTSYLCGKCKSVLAESITEGKLTNMILKCNNCQSFNEVPCIKLPKRGGW